MFRELPDLSEQGRGSVADVDHGQGTGFSVFPGVGLRPEDGLCKEWNYTIASALGGRFDLYEIRFPPPLHQEVRLIWACGRLALGFPAMRLK
jgi:hypothetical protein